MKSTTLLSAAFSLLTLAALWVPVAQGQDAALPAFDPAGKLEGRVLYANGNQAKVNVNLERTPNGSVFAGTYTLTLITEDRPEVLEGKVQAVVEGDVVRAQFDKLSAEGKLAKAGSHAKFAVYGTFAEPGGVFMLYRYGR